MFNLNFISNPGMQIEDSNATWSYVIQEDNIKLDGIKEWMTIETTVIYNL